MMPGDVYARAQDLLPAISHVHQAVGPGHPRALPVLLHVLIDVGDHVILREDDLVEHLAQIASGAFFHLWEDGPYRWLPHYLILAVAEELLGKVVHPRQPTALVQAEDDDVPAVQYVLVPLVDEGQLLFEPFSVLHVSSAEDGHQDVPIVIYQVLASRL